MKEIKAQLSYDILKNILPLSAIDASRDVLNTVESEMLFTLWKKAEKQYGKATLPLDVDRMIVSSLKIKGYIEHDGGLIDFTKRGREAIRQILLGEEENTFQKKAKQ